MAKPNSLNADLGLILKVVVIFAIIIAAFAWFMQPAPLGGDFTLTDSDGHQVTQADLRAKPAAVFFGYTSCPDVCPTTVFDLQDWLKQLSPQQRAALNVWFITVDPERDTPQILHDYLAPVAPLIAPAKFRGISGDPAGVHKLVQSFKIAAEKRPGEDGNYTYDHTSAVLLLNKGGRLRGIIPYKEQKSIAVEQLKSLADSVK